MACQLIKAEHQKPAGLLQPLEIPQWKWEHLTMDFISGLPTTSRGNNAIWVIVNHMSKSAHFLPLKTEKKMQMLSLAQTFVKKIVIDMVNQSLSHRIEIVNSSQYSGKLWMSPWVQNFNSARHITHR